MHRLEKALHQIEQALKRPKPDAPESDAAQKIISNLHDLLNKTQGNQLYPEADELSEDTDRARNPHSPHGVDTGDSLSLDDAENPLQLLARASDLQLPPAEVRSFQRWRPLEPLQPTALPQNNNAEDDSSTARLFFVPVKAHLDLGSDMDPVELGLVTLDEAESLFAFFYQDLAHTRWGLDPVVHTASFVRSQSAFLFTSIMAAAALFLPSAAALSKRLSRHCKSLAQMVIAKRFRSVEIVLAFMVNVPWMAHGNYLGDDDTCSYIAMALAIALDLSLNKIVLPSTSFDNGVIRRLAKADCIDAKRALHMDGFDNVDPNSEWGQRLLRRRERTWIALFVLERGVCLARGRSYTVPQTSLIVSCDRWHVSNFADARDGPMNSMAALRRNLDDLFKKVKSSCDNYQVTDAGSEAAQSLVLGGELIQGKAYSLPPYVEILVTHTRLSTYGGVINHPTAPLEVKRFFRAAGLSSALNVMRAAIQGESRLKSMPNNTVIMISFAACSALSLSVAPTDTRSSLAPSVRTLIEETAGVLERIGATPSHRNGASVLYGRYLRELVRRGSENQNEPRMPAEATLRSPSAFDGYGTVPPVSQPSFSPLLWSEPLQFSAMSDGQIIDAVNRAGITFGTGVPDVPLDDIMSWDCVPLLCRTDIKKSAQYSTATAEQPVRMPEIDRAASKLFRSADDAVADLRSGSTILSSGFGLCGVAETIISAIHRRGPEHLHSLTAVSNNAGAPGRGGLSTLTQAGQVNRLILSYLGNNKALEKKYLTGDIAIELCPQGTLAERLRAGGAGIPAFFTPTGAHTFLQEGQIPVRLDKSGKVLEHGKPRETRIFNGKTYLMESALTGDVAILRAWKADEAGNCVFRYTTKAFSPLVAKAATLTIVEAENIVPVGSIDPDDVDLPGIFVDRIVPATVPKSIEIKKLRSTDDAGAVQLTKDAAMVQRNRIAKRAAKELKQGYYVNLGVGQCEPTLHSVSAAHSQIGIPTLAPSFLPEGVKVWVQSENGLLGMALEVSAKGDLANYMIPGKVFKGMGGAMDLISNPDRTKIVVATSHTAKDGSPKIVSECELPLTGANCVSTIITDLCVFQVDRDKGELLLTELAPGVEVEEVQSKTGAKFTVAKQLELME
ncbi:hypothetical protein APSETT445_005534 [Aspergillus pseudonomiae]